MIRGVLYPEHIQAAHIGYYLDVIMVKNSSNIVHISKKKNLKDSESVVVSPDCISVVRRYTYLGVMTAYGKSENAFVTESTLS